MPKDKAKRKSKFGDRLSCQVCFESFQKSGDHVPRILPCRHTLCHKCVGQWIRKNRLECPECLSTHSILSKQKAFPRDKKILAKVRKKLFLGHEKPSALGKGFNQELSDVNEDSGLGTSSECENHELSVEGNKAPSVSAKCDDLNQTNIVKYKVVETRNNNENDLNQTKDEKPSVRQNCGVDDDKELNSAGVQKEQVAFGICAEHGRELSIFCKEQGCQMSSAYLA